MRGPIERVWEAPARTARDSDAPEQGIRSSQSPCPVDPQPLAPGFATTAVTAPVVARKACFRMNLLLTTRGPAPGLREVRWPAAPGPDN